MTLSPDDPRHGTSNGYNGHHCRCRPCTDAKNAYQRQWLHDRGVMTREQRSEVDAADEQRVLDGFAQWLADAAIYYRDRYLITQSGSDELPGKAVH